MKPGMDFAKQLDHQVAQCRVLLAVIGPHWFDAKDKSGARRLDSDKDYVRVELATALERDITVIPILVDGAVLPAEDSLSDDLKPLAPATPWNCGTRALPPTPKRSFMRSNP